VTTIPTFTTLRDADEYQSPFHHPLNPAPHPT
jgi:hypothetical protein